MQVRDENEVGVGVVGARGDAPDPAQRPDPGGEQRVGEDDPSAELDPRRRVAEKPHSQIPHGIQYRVPPDSADP